MKSGITHQVTGKGVKMPDSFVLMLSVVVVTQCLVEIKFRKYWYVMPAVWFVFVLSNFLLGYFLQSHIGVGLDFYAYLLSLFLQFSSPTYILIALHFVLVRLRRKPDTEKT